MKKLNKLTACFLAAVMSVSSAVSAADDTEPVEGNTVLAVTETNDNGEWSVPEPFNSTVTFNETKTDVQLHCKTTSRKMAIAEIVSPPIDTAGGENGIIRLRFDMEATGFGTNHTAVISAYNPDASYAAEIFELSGAGLSVFGNPEIEVSDGEEMKIDAVFDITTKQYSVTINDDIFITGEDENISYLDKNNIHIQAQSYWLKNIIAETTLKLKNMNFTSDKGFAFYGFFAGETGIQSICSKEYCENGITVRFDGIGSSEMYLKENYEVFQNGTEAVFDVLNADGGVVIEFGGDIHAGDDISIQIKSLRDVFGNAYDAGSGISFKVADSDYIAPEAEMICSKTELVKGETAEILIRITGSSWMDVKIYINDEFYDFFEQEEFTFEFTPDKAASYTVKAVVEDEYGAIKEKEVVLDFSDNEEPEVLFDGFTNGGVKSYDIEEEKNIHIISTDDTDVNYTELYLNGKVVKTVTENEYVWNLDDEGILLGKNELKAVVYDMYGLKNEFIAYAEITKQLMTEVISETEFKESNSKFGSGISITREKGVARVEKTDNEHGKSLIMGMDETYVATEKTGYTHVNTSRNQTHMRQEYGFEMCIKKSPVLETGLTFGVRRSNGAVVAMMLVNNGELKFGNNVFEYEEHKWYKMKFFVSFENENQYYDVYIDNSLIASGIKVDFSNASTGYRFFTTTNTDNMCSIAIDNIKVEGEVKSFMIKGISDSIESPAAAVIKPGVNLICLHIDGYVVKNDLNMENISVYTGAVRQEIKRIGYNEENKIILIETALPLKERSAYTVRFSENIRLIDNITIDSPMEFSFEVLPKDIEVFEISRKIRKQNSEITVSISNNSEDNKKLYVFATVFDEGRFVKTYVFGIEINAFTKSENFIMSVNDSADKELQVFVTDSVNISNIYKTVMYD